MYTYSETTESEENNKKKKKKCEKIVKRKKKNWRRECEAPEKPKGYTTT